MFFPWVIHVYFFKDISQSISRQEIGPDSVSVSSAFTNRKIWISFNNSEKKIFSTQFFQPKAHPLQSSEVEPTQGIVWPIVNERTMNSPLPGLSYWLHGKEDISSDLNRLSISSGGEGNDNPLQYPCLENPMNRGDCWAAVHRVAQSRTQLKWLSMHACMEKEMATHSSVLAWRIPGTEEPGGLPSMGLHRVRHDKQLSSSSSSINS